MPLRDSQTDKPLPGPQDFMEQRKLAKASGQKKLITDFAFYEDLNVKLHFLKQVQDDLDHVIPSNEANIE